MGYLGSRNIAGRSLNLHWEPQKLHCPKAAFKAAGTSTPATSDLHFDI